MKRQLGMALLIVLLLISTLSVIAINSQDAWKQIFWRTEAQLSQQQIRFILLGAEDLIRIQVISNISQDNVHARQAWAQKNMHFQLGDDRINYAITDMNACFNINTLALPGALHGGDLQNGEIPWRHQVFLKILENLGVDEIKGMLFLKRLQPLLPLADITELRAVTDVGRELWLRLKPMLCVHPAEKNRININSLQGHHGAILLRSLMLNHISLAEAAEALEKYSDSNWEQGENIFNSLSQEPVRVALSKMQSGVTHTSDSFSVKIWMDINDFRYELTSQMQRDKNAVFVTQHHFGIEQ
jgi:general secretion pathway protein K